ncbi:MAG: bifunctional riboflavin kinase/FAD synthetase [Clostridia bacterium]|nr:bifunctional riboflavin kinase/FAD synthetase [Clostridia bacterium]
MLKTVWFSKQDNRKQGAVILLGGFDGLHVGHRQLLARAKESGLPVGVMTMSGVKQENSLFTFAEREKIFQSAGVDFTFELSFDEVKDLTPVEFLQLLESAFSPKCFVCGSDFRFGKNAEGNAQNIKEATQVCVDVLPLLKINEVKVSSSCIKTLLKEGDLPTANQLLGHPFFLMGEVYRDRQVGRSIGFPTANISYPQDKFPLKLGVYETRVEVDGVVYKGITNYGARPTFDNGEIVTETHLLGFDGNLYGRTLQVEFIRFLRENKRFESVEQLQAQLEKDSRQVRDQ